MTSTSLSKNTVQGALVPISKAIALRGNLIYKIDLVATVEYGQRPYFMFDTDSVFVDAKNGILRFEAPVSAIGQFIWNVVFKRKGKGNPVGEYVDVYVRGYYKSKHVATATITGHITVCNNVGSGKYVIEIQANKEIKVEHVG